MFDIRFGFILTRKWGEKTLVFTWCAKVNGNCICKKRSSSTLLCYNTPLCTLNSFHFLVLHRSWCRSSFHSHTCWRCIACGFPCNRFSVKVETVFLHAAPDSAGSTAYFHANEIERMLNIWKKEETPAKMLLHTAIDVEWQRINIAFCFIKAIAPCSGSPCSWYKVNINLSQFLPFFQLALTSFETQLLLLLIP